MSQSAAKFTFDTEFHADGDRVSNAARARQKKSYTHDEIDALCAKARDAGLKAGQVRAQEEVAAALGQLTATIRERLTQTHHDIEVVRGEAAELALACAKKIARAAIAAAPATEVEAALREAIHQAIGEPRIVIKATPAVAAALENTIADIAAEEGYDGRVFVTADPHMKGADCRLEWRGAGAEHTTERIEAALADVIARRFSQVSPKG